MLLEGRNAIVTGGSKGIGAATALKLAQEGANICITDLTQQDEAKEIIDNISATGRKVIFVQADVASFKQSADVVGQALDEFGRLDILVNNAGMNWDGVCWKMGEEQWDRVIAVNLTGCFNFIRHVAPLFREQKYGKIINVSSINALRGKFGQTNYSAAKAGLIGHTKAVARELGKYGINVNAVAPGLIETAMIRESEDRDRIIDKAMAEIALKRVGQPEDMANVIAFLASDWAKHVTGEVIKVDGGQYI